MSADSLIVVWKDDEKGARCRCRWTLRNITRDGDFFGVATIYDEGRHANLRGRLSEQDTAEVWRLFTAILDANPPTPELDAKQDWHGLLARGAYGDPDVIYHYYRGEEQRSGRAVDFHSLTTLLRPYAETALLNQSLEPNVFSG